MFCGSPQVLEISDNPWCSLAAGHVTPIATSSLSLCPNSSLVLRTSVALIEGLPLSSGTTPHLVGSI